MKEKEETSKRCIYERKRREMKCQKVLADGLFPSKIYMKKQYSNAMKNEVVSTYRNIT